MSALFDPAFLRRLERMALVAQHVRAPDRLIITYWR